MVYFLDWSNNEIDNLNFKASKICSDLEMLSSFSSREAFEIRAISDKLRRSAEYLETLARRLEGNKYERA